VQFFDFKAQSIAVPVPISVAVAVAVTTRQQALHRFTREV
jgi:hypothetical protein